MSSGPEAARVHRAHRQVDSTIRFEWGVDGALALAEGADVAVVVDVLSFTTTLSVAIDLGAEVWPYRWRDTGAADLAARHDAVLAVGRSQALAALAEDGRHLVSLSPASLRRAPAPPRLVLPSPNGSTIAAALAEGGVPVIGACLRNVSAVAAWVRDQLERSRSSSPGVVVIAAGERWPSGALRPAVEDLWGACAVISALAGPWTSRSSEAEVARTAYEAIRGSERAALAGCASGRELTSEGYGDDVEVAADVDASRCVPLLEGQRFVDAAVGGETLG